MSVLVLPGPLQSRLEAAARGFLSADMAVDFRNPAGEPALASADSVAWRVFKNPVALFVGGVAAVILELAEPRVRAGVWDHTGFRADPLRRLKRTGLAAMATVFAARSVAEPMIAGVGRLHGRISGVADDGRAYRADDPELLDWVQATASFGFLTAYDRFVRTLPAEAHDAFFAEAVPAARLYGATGAPQDAAAFRALLDRTLPTLAASPVIFEFLEIVRRAPAFPGPLQALFVRAAVEITPPEVRSLLGLDASCGLRRGEGALARLAGAAADRLVLHEAPPAQACLRLGLPADHLYRQG